MGLMTFWADIAPLWDSTPIELICLSAGRLAKGFRQQDEETQMIHGIGSSDPTSS